MSLILDALNRSRQDTDTVPGLATSHYTESDESGLASWRQWLPWLALLCALLVIGWLLMGKMGNQALTHNNSEVAALQGDGVGSGQQGGKAADVLSVGQESSAATTATPPPQPVSPTPPRTTPRVRPGAQATQPSKLAAGPHRASASQSGVGLSRVAAAPPAGTSAAVPEADAAIARLYQGNAKPASTQSVSQVPAKIIAPPEPEAREEVAEEQPIDIAEVISRAKQELGKAPLAEHPAPLLASLSQQAKDTIPTLMYQRHEFASDTGGASVVINGKTVRVGGTVASGVRVEEILPNSVILSHQGAQFRLRALNSWVNL